MSAPTLARRAGTPSAARIPETSVDKYRSESHYGPEDAVLNPAFPREGKWEFSGAALYSPFSSLNRNYGYGGSLTVHINRRHAIEPLYFAYHKAELSSFAKTQIRDKIGASEQSANSIEIPRQTFAGSYFFSPYYSKMHITERTVAHFDVFTGLGFGIIRSAPLSLDGQLGAQINRPAAVFTAGLRFLLPPRFAMRVELRDFVHSMQNFQKTSKGNSLQISLSTSIFFGAFPD